jgi:acetyl esterase/lipase
MRRRCEFLTMAIVFCAAASAQETAKYKTETGIPYRSEKDAGFTPYMAERCKLDVYFPEDGKDFSTVVWFHGGGLTGGQKSIPKGLKNAGFAIVAAGYRLSPGVKGSECIDDAAAAVAWTVNNIAKYGGKPENIFVSGHSAGAYLTDMIGLDKRWLEKYGVDANRLAGLISLSAQAVTHFTIRAERGISDKRAIIDELAPIYHARGNAPPILLLTGDREKEMLGRYEENAYLYRMLKVNGHKDVTLYELQGYGHDMVEPGIKPLLDFVKRVRR